MREDAAPAVSTLLFDFDGTICDSFEAFVEAINRHADEFGFRPALPDELPRLRGRTARQILEERGLSLLKLPFLVRKVRRTLHAGMHALRPIAGVPEAIRAAREQGFRLGIVTTNSVENVRAFLERHGIAGFDLIRSETNVFGKGRAIRRVLREEGLRPEATAYLGDEARDIEAAQAAQVRMVAVAWGFNTLELLEAHRPAHLARTPEELAELLRSWRAPSSI